MTAAAWFTRAATRWALGVALLPAVALAQGLDKAFERDLFQTRFEHEVKFRAAAIEVAWAAEAVCDTTTQVEPFVLMSLHSIRRRMGDEDLKLYSEVTGMDQQWRVVWMDEAAPDELRLKDAVTHINGRALPGGSARWELGNLLRGGALLARDDEGYWAVLQQARKEASEGKPMTITLASGRVLAVETQKGCAGSVTASAFDADPDTFWRQGTTRVKIPANAMIEARSTDEFRWLAAFGVFFQASRSAIQAVQRSEGASTGFTVGKILLFAVPGAGMMLSVAEAQAEKAIAVDSIVGSADLFANEVVAAMGGDPSAGYQLSQRLRQQGLKVDAVMMDEFRHSNASEHARRIKAIQAAQAERERAEAKAADEAQLRAQEKALKEALNEALKAPARPAPAPNPR